MNAKTTRRRFLRTAAGGAAWVALGAAVASTLGCEPDRRTTATAAQAGKVWSFRSRPDLKPPGIMVTTPARGTAPGFVFCAPKNGPGEAGPGQDGCLILDDRGQPVWFRPLQSEVMDVMDFKVQRGLAHKLQATTRSGGLFRIELPLLAADPDFWCKVPSTS